MYVIEIEGTEVSGVSQTTPVAAKGKRLLDKSRFILDWIVQKPIFHKLFAVHVLSESPEAGQFDLGRGVHHFGFWITFSALEPNRQAIGRCSFTSVFSGLAPAGRFYVSEA